MIEFILATGLLIADWGQTNHIATDSRYVETNRVLGYHPTQNRVDQYFGTLIVANTAAWLLPKKYRKPIWNTVSIIQGSYVMGNYRMGIKVMF